METPITPPDFSEVFDRLEAAGWRPVRGRCGGGGGGAVDVGQAVRGALASPDDFPPLDQIVVPGDRVAVVLAGHTPQAAAVVTAVVEMLRGVEPASVDVVVDNPGRTDLDPDTLASRFETMDVRIVGHDGRDRESLSYVGADAEALPIYLNRAVADADWVLPVIVDGGTGGDSATSLLYPALTDAEARARHARAGIDPARHRSGDGGLPGGFDDPAFLIGVQLTLHLTVDDAGRIASAHARMDRRPEDEVLRKTDQTPVTVAILSRPDPTWDAVLDALENATASTTPGGRVAVWAERFDPPDDRLRRTLDDEHPTDDAMPPDEEPDADAAFRTDHDVDTDNAVDDDLLAPHRRLRRLLSVYRIAFCSPGGGVDSVAASSAAGVDEMLRWLAIDDDPPGRYLTAADVTAGRSVAASAAPTALR